MGAFDKLSDRKKNVAFRRNVRPLWLDLIIPLHHIIGLLHIMDRSVYSAILTRGVRK